VSAAPLTAATAALVLLFGAACQRARQDASPRPVTPTPADTAPAAPPLRRVIVVDRKCMGTLCEVKVLHHDEGFVRAGVARGLAEMDRIEALTTSWNDTSDVARINQAAGKQAVKVDPDTVAVIEKGLWMSERSAGAFDITVGVFKGLWKFDEDNDGTLPEPAEVRRRRRLVNYKDVLVDRQAGTVKLRRPGQRLNLEGLAKGYGVDAAVKAMRDAGLRDFIFHAGGDLYASGRKDHREWRVGIQDPRADRGRIVFDLLLSDKAFNTSGDYERFVMKDGVRYHHILDARTGFPSKLCRSTTILAGSAFTADTLDTAVCLMGAKAGMKLVEQLDDVEAVIIDPQNRVHVSSGLNGKIVKRADPTPGI
jgi:thiamine biosynthesis lipoprotein